MIQGLQRGLEAGAFLANHAGRRNTAILEVQLSGWGSLDAQLVLQAAHTETCIILVHHECGDATGTSFWIRDSHDGVPAGTSAVGDEALGAVDDPVIAIAHCAGLHSAGIGASLALGEGVGSHLTIGDVLQNLALELLGAVEDQTHGSQLVHRGNQGGRTTHASHFLDDDDSSQGISALPAEFIGHVDGVEARGVQRLKSLFWEALVLIHISCVGSDLLLCQSADGAAEFQVLIGEAEGLEVRVKTHSASATFR